MGLFNKIKTRLKIDKTNDKSVIDEDTDPYYLLRFDIKEFRSKAENFRWFFHQTECVGILTGLSDEYAYGLYKNEEAVNEALELATIRYTSFTIDEAYKTITKQYYQMHVE